MIQELAWFSAAFFAAAGHLKIAGIWAGEETWAEFTGAKPR